MPVLEAAKVVLPNGAMALTGVREPIDAEKRLFEYGPQIAEARTKLEKNLTRCGLNSEVMVTTRVRDVI